MLDPARKKSCPGEGGPQQEKWRGGRGHGIVQEDLTVRTSCQKGALAKEEDFFQKCLFDRKYLAGSQPPADALPKFKFAGKGSSCLAHDPRCEEAERWGGP